MKNKLIKKTPIEERYVWFVNEREKIRIKKNKNLPKPWTDNETLQSYRFCNVRRMDDVVSQWLLNNWYMPYHDHRNMLLAICFGRFINRPSTLEKIGFPKAGWNPAKVAKKLRDIRDSGNTVFNSAYIVRGNNGIDKIASVVDHYCTPIYKSKIKLFTDSMKTSHELMHEQFGFGSFMAGQVVADARFAIKGTWGDKKYWAPPGPGSQRGINRILNYELHETWKIEEFAEEGLPQIIKLGSNCDKKLVKKMEAIDWQNTLCEFDKFERVLWNEGQMRRKYNGN